MLNENQIYLLEQFDTGLLGKMEALMKEFSSLKFYYAVKKNVIEIESYNDVLFKQYNGGITVLIFLNKDEAIDYNIVNDYEIKEISFYEICCKFCDDYNYVNLELLYNDKKYVFMYDDVSDYIVYIENNLE